VVLIAVRMSHPRDALAEQRRKGPGTEQ
jgi:hypothetical protein